MEVQGGGNIKVNFIQIKKDGINRLNKMVRKRNIQ